MERSDAFFVSGSNSPRRSSRRKLSFPVKRVSSVSQDSSLVGDTSSQQENDEKESSLQSSKEYGRWTVREIERFFKFLHLFAKEADGHMRIDYVKMAKSHRGLHPSKNSQQIRDFYYRMVKKIQREYNKCRIGFEVLDGPEVLDAYYRKQRSLFRPMSTEEEFGNFLFSVPSGQENSGFYRSLSEIVRGRVKARLNKAKPLTRAHGGIVESHSPPKVGLQKSSSKTTSKLVCAGKSVEVDTSESPSIKQSAQHLGKLLNRIRAFVPEDHFDDLLSAIRQGTASSVASEAERTKNSESLKNSAVTGVVTSSGEGDKLPSADVGSVTTSTGSASPSSVSIEVHPKENFLAAAIEKDGGSSRFRFRCSARRTVGSLMRHLRRKRPSGMTGELVLRSPTTARHYSVADGAKPLLDLVAGADRPLLFYWWKVPESEVSGQSAAIVQKPTSFRGRSGNASQLSGRAVSFQRGYDAGSPLGGQILKGSVGRPQVLSPPITEVPVSPGMFPAHFPGFGGGFELTNLAQMPHRLPSESQCTCLADRYGGGLEFLNTIETSTSEMVAQKTSKIIHALENSISGFESAARGPGEGFRGDGALDFAAGQGMTVPAVSNVSMMGPPVPSANADFTRLAQNLEASLRDFRDPGHIGATNSRRTEFVKPAPAKSVWSALQQETTTPFGFESTPQAKPATNPVRKRKIRGISSARKSSPDGKRPHTSISEQASSQSGTQVMENSKVADKRMLAEAVEMEQMNQSALAVLDNLSPKRMSRLEEGLQF